ncbi:MAG TPA: DNA (cytosine-5-)-methyltransferase [Pirellulales bacterium]|nr:DNA (cytosine-5-)-methyltransferase [Pirellulales bacterium]
MDAIELFAGIGGFRLAADKVGLNTIWANDNCSKASKIYRDRFGQDTFREGDIRGLVDSIPRHQILTAGFPCQPFSSAGKKQGIKDPRGTLFSVVVDVLRLQRPTYFVLENVKRLLTMERGIHFATILASLAELDYRIEWRLFNAMDFGLPQNRQRVFITGVRRRETHSNGDRSHFENTIRLASLDDLSKSHVEAGAISSRESWTEISRHGKKFPNWGLAESGKFYAADIEHFSEQQPAVFLRSVLQDEVEPEFDFTESTIERIKASKHVRRFVAGVEILSNQGGGARMGYTVFGIGGVAPTLTSTASRHYERYQVGDRYRRLTNVEYARIQGFPDDHCSCVSVYDQYALYGNAVPPPMAEWVVRRAISKGVPVHSLPRRPTQRKLFADA